jgi:pimeloyl-ACP methyl ester carboxylesterase
LKQTALVALTILAVADVGEPRSIALSESCNPITGLDGPLPTCSEVVCDRPAVELGVEVVTWATIVPMCRTSNLDIRPFFSDGPPRTRVGISGVERYSCLYEPPGASSISKRPLVVWLHGGGAGTADNVYDATSIRTKAVDYDLSNDPDRPGFFLLSVQGRSLQYPTSAPRDGHHHDFYYRDLGSPSANPDVANLDALVDELVSTGRVDPQRIYVMGWSNGGFFSQMYGIARSVTPTPGGNRVASVVAFTAADPFHNTRQDQSPSCRLEPYPTSSVPILLISRSCDIVACDEEQLARLGIEFPSPGHVVSTWQHDLLARIGNENVERIIVAGNGRITNVCSHSFLCSLPVATLNHLRWPDGVADLSDRDHEPAMLNFLRDHPLVKSPPAPRRVSGRRK